MDMFILTDDSTDWRTPSQTPLRTWESSAFSNPLWFETTPEVRQGPQTLLCLGMLSGSLSPLGMLAGFVFGDQYNTFFPSTVLHFLCSDHQLLQRYRSFPGLSTFMGLERMAAPNGCEWNAMLRHAFCGAMQGMGGPGTWVSHRKHVLHWNHVCKGLIPGGN